MSGSFSNSTDRVKRPANNLFKLKTPPLKRTKLAPTQSTLNIFSSNQRSKSTLGLGSRREPLEITSDSELNKSDFIDLTGSGEFELSQRRDKGSLSQTGGKQTSQNHGLVDLSSIASKPISFRSSTASKPVSLLSRTTSFNHEFADIDFDDDLFLETEKPNNLKNSKPLGSIQSATSSRTSSFRTSSTSVQSSGIGNGSKVKSQNDSILNAVAATSQRSTGSNKNTAPWSNMRHVPSKRNPRVKESDKITASFAASTSKSEFTLSEEQQHVVDLVVRDGTSLFFTGSAGTGKSVILRELVRRLTMKYGAKAVGITASTGLAACNIGGITINRFAGVGIAEKRAEELLKMLQKKQEIKEQWKRVKVLIIDEISMLDGLFFEKLEYIARKIRSDPRPFGNIQVVLTGDFFQLPPVPSKNGPPQRFCFESNCWSSVIKKTILLKQVFRQKDPVFANLLNNLRVANVDDELTREFQQLARPVQYEDGIPPTELFPTRAEVENSNRRVLASLKGKTMIFDAKDLGHPTQLYLLENTMAPKRLVLKEGANVMMLKNKDDTLVNGSVGTVITFLPKMVFDTINAKFHQLQLTQEALIQEIKALSQCHGQSETSKEVEDFAAKSVLGPSEFFKLANGMNSYEPLPVVKFVNRGVSRLECIDREDFKAGGEKENNNLERSQIPLLLSWALSIHKSQGQTLDRVKVDLTKVFEVGQVYTALSRATSRERLQVINFQRSKIHTHEKVKTFYQRLQSFDN